MSTKHIHSVSTLGGNCSVFVIYTFFLVKRKKKKAPKLFFSSDHVTDWIREINLIREMKQCTITLWDQLLSLYNLLQGLHLQSPTRSKPISWLESARNKIEHLSDSRSKCSSPVILLSNTDLRIYMENTEQYIVPEIIFIQRLFFFKFKRSWWSCNASKFKLCRWNGRF